MLYKKNPRIDTFRYVPVISMVVLNIVLLLVFSAFEWKTEDKPKFIGCIDPLIISEEEPLLWQRFESITTKYIYTEEKTNSDDSPWKRFKREGWGGCGGSKDTITIYPLTDEQPLLKEKDVYLITEEQTQPQGGLTNFYNLIKLNLKYPKEARKQKIEGRVYLSFIVEPDGSLSNIQVIRGIEGGCNEEAIRLLQLSSKWIPGKNRGIAVKTRMSIPVQFKL